jgi:hypothetical protein
VPNLETAFACQAVFGIPAHELFPAIYQNVEKVIQQRATQLREKLDGMPATAMRKYKRKALSAITSPKVATSAQMV